MPKTTHEQIDLIYKEMIKKQEDDNISACELNEEVEKNKTKWYSQDEVEQLKKELEKLLKENKLIYSALGIKNTFVNCELESIINKLNYQSSPDCHGVDSSLDKIHGSENSSGQDIYYGKVHGMATKPDKRINDGKYRHLSCMRKQGYGVRK